MAFNWQFWKKGETPSSEAPPAPPQVTGQPEDKDGSWSDFFKKFKGNMPQLLAAAKNPSVLKKVREIEDKMKKDGVDTADMKAVQAWIEKNKEAIMPKPLPKVATVHREEAKIGRNDPCSCGSGKKYKKCHGVEAAA